MFQHNLDIPIQACQPAVRVTSHTELVFPLPAPRHAPGPAPAGLDKERAALLAALRPALTGARSRPAAGQGGNRSCSTIELVRKTRALTLN